MNQDPATQTFSLSLDSSPDELQATLQRLLVPGPIMDSRLTAYRNRLQERFNLFCSTCPVAQWDKGLVITPEIRCQTEIYLPLAEIQAAFRSLFLRSFHYTPFLPAVPMFTTISWVDALERIHIPGISFNPARIITEVAADYSQRLKFLAALFIPKRYGGSSDRYPLQKAFLHEWLGGKNTRKLSMLDAACGSGEGVYELAQLAADAVGHCYTATVHGCTVEPLELVAAAHGWFPHDSAREQAFKRILSASGKRGEAGTIGFFREDICQPADNPARYDVVICNGLLGGPLLHEPNALDEAVKGLAQRVKKGGILLAADKFHAGWRRSIPHDQLKSYLVKHGIRLMNLPEGIGGIRI